MNKLNVVENWAVLVRRAWSIRLALLSALLSAAEFALPMVPDVIADAIGRGRFAAGAFAISMAAAVARIVAQPRMWK